MICSGCNKPVLEGEHRWAGHAPEEDWHYDCAQTARLTAQVSLFGLRAIAPAESRKGRELPNMFTHIQVWNAIEELARHRGWSLSALAVRARLDATALNRSKRFGPDGKPRWPSTQTIAMLLRATDVTLGQFCALVEQETQPAAGLADILVVDDTPDIGEAYGAALRKAGYRVHVASDHAGALELIEREKHIDLLCTDVVMPEGLGGVALARLAQLRLPHLKVMYITGYDIPSLAGQSDLCLLRKPLSGESLVRGVEGLLRRAPAIAIP
jgi:CheY-like chemotaxis protein